MPTTVRRAIPSYAEDTEKAPSVLRRRTSTRPAVAQASTIRPQSGIVGTADAPSPSAINPVTTPATGMRPTVMTSVRPAGMTNTPGSVPSQAQQSVDAARARVGSPGGGIDVRGYVGSMWAPPGSYTAIRGGITPVQPYNAEQGADKILRTRFGAPPNERGQIDAATTLPRKDYGGATLNTRTNVAQTPGASLPAQPIAPPAPQQTEAANPLTGDRNGQMEDTTAAIQDPARAVGFSSRGGGNPRGMDAAPSDPNTGGTGIYARRFGSSAAAAQYDSYVKRLFGGQAPA